MLSGLETPRGHPGGRVSLEEVLSVFTSWHCCLYDPTTDKSQKNNGFYLNLKSGLK